MAGVSNYKKRKHSLDLCFSEWLLIAATGTNFVFRLIFGIR